MIQLRPYQQQAVADLRANEGVAVGYLTIIRKSHSTGGTMWECLCKCGTSVFRSSSQLNRKLRTGGFSSCGCRTRPNQLIDGEKVCTKCQRMLPASMFAAYKRSSSGLSPRCKDCQRDWRVANRDYLIAEKRKYWEANRDRLIKKASERQKQNKELSNARSKKWREENKERRREVANSWVRRNKDYAAFQATNRRSMKLSATPEWANMFFIKEAYLLARKRTEMTGVKWCVDHVVPLRGKTVCGLHVEHNLAVITQLENFSKNNRHWPDMP